MIRDIKLGDRFVGSGHPPLIVAEMSGNHNQSLDRALAIVDEAAKAGAHAVKLQTYTADTMTLDLEQNEFYISEKNSLWNGYSLYKLYQEAYTPWEWHKPIFEKCMKLGMIAFSTPFDNSAVDFLEELNVPCYKIASPENTDLPLIKKVASTGKPVIISTGTATIAELDDSIRCARESGCRDLILLKCSSSYPASPSESNLVTIPHLSNMFNCQVGLSDHTLGIGAAIASVALGASLIEKHVTLKRADGGVDSAFSLEPAELQALVIESERAWQALGQIKYGPTYSEKASIRGRRSLYITKDIKAGETLTSQNLGLIRPGLGLPPKYYELLQGKKILCDAKKGTPLKWDLIIK